ncbi:DUF1992 domain-containing protein [Aeromicrobium senzhongii]|uniref:DUF1992 domain-containing protein n=1 Tax=Aeromicrobium senzhongii TaxID=2663859 RepID=A0ABX6SPT5_9ACTN|nr:DUF1992 domain-containing protein [Aeromicrobium senzhongii]MTB87116.1 DUF1992 domain-containing protein [Aeromicrobium senzhongii]QNL93071.1 DUF1992 domain-containing protein [Aeromicrobium senzhongii]
MDEDARNRAARYRMDPDAERVDESADDEAPAPPPRRPEDQTLWVDQQVRAAMARGEFDDLPHAGKPLPHIDTAAEPDWWLKRFIEREQITGVLPEALQLRKDDAILDEQLDSLRSERAVREAVEEFDRRIVAARRQLQGGPPVVTQLRDIEVEVAAWRARRGRRTQATSVPAPEPSPRGRHSKGVGSPAPTRMTSA